MHFDLHNRISLLTLAGSHAYGTANSESDIDLRGICVAPLNIRLSIYKLFDQYEGKLPIKVWTKIEQKVRTETGKTEQEILVPTDDVVIYDVAKAIKLMGDCNPNMFDLAFCDDSDVLMENKIGKLIRENKNLFLCTKVKYTYSGYAHAQLKKIKRHRQWLLSPPQKRPERKDFGLPDHQSLLCEADSNKISEEIEHLVRSWGVDEFEMKPAELIVLQEHMRKFWSSVLLCKDEAVDLKLRDVAGAELGLSSQVREALDRERKYRVAVKQWKSYERWKRERNPARKKMEEQFFYDCKHASHLIRLMRMGCEILQTGEVNVKRPDAEELLAIRKGERDYQSIVDEAETLEVRMEDLYKKNPCNLPKKIQTEKLDDLTRQLIFMGLS